MALGTNMNKITENNVVPIARLDRGNGHFLAYHRLSGRNKLAGTPGIIFMGGFRSDMTGSKATALEAYCREEGHEFLRFDYFGHGQSSGDFREGTIGRWKEDAIAVLDQLTEGPQILIGSSLGGWLMLLAALERPEKIAGLVGIAPAPDFTEDLVWNALTPDAQQEIIERGEHSIPDCYGDAPYPITRLLIEEARNHLLLRNEKLPIDCPVRLLHGVRDQDVPPRYSIALAEKLITDDVHVTLVKDGDHRMSAPAQIQLLCATVEELLKITSRAS